MTKWCSIQHIGGQPEKLFYTVANPSCGLLNRQNRRWVNNILLRYGVKYRKQSNINIK